MKYDLLANEEAIARTVQSLKASGIEAVVVQSKGDALKLLLETIPDNAELMTGSSRSLEEIGFVDFLNNNTDRYRNLKNAIFAERDPKKQANLRRLSSGAEYFIGSVHAVSETGEVVVASATGSQLAGYVYVAEHVIWVAGTQKIASTLSDAIKRVEEYVLPLEDKRMKSVGFPGSHIAKMLIFHDEVPGRITMILVKEKLGF